MNLHLMTAEAAVDLVIGLRSRGADVTVGGGWSVDALLGRQTRPHSDLDLWASADAFEALVAGLVASGVDRVFPWPGDKPWNFVVHDGRERRVDLHIYEDLGAGILHYGGAAGSERFSAQHLAGRGVIAGTAVKCETASWALECHTGYQPRPIDYEDVRHLCEHLGMALPAAYRSER